MSGNLLQTLQQLVQDVIAPDVRELKVRVTSLEKQVDSLEKHMEARFTAMEKQMDARFAAMQMQIDTCFVGIEAHFDALEARMDLQFRGILAAISESKMQAELTSVRLLSSLSERVAILQTRRQ